MLDSISPPTSESARDLDQKIEDAGVAGDVGLLTASFSDDLQFTHGNGLVQNKAEWIGSLTAPAGRFKERRVSDVEVELHGDVAVTTGRLDVTLVDRRYAVRYVRVYAWRASRWQLLSHRTVGALPPPA